jgi:hypothetical protein
VGIFLTPNNRYRNGRETYLNTVDVETERFQ